jgi:D-aminopeptidase
MPCDFLDQRLTIMLSTHRRARDFGLDLPGTPGPNNAITDVPGVEVGFATIQRPAVKAGQAQVFTGVTAILPRGRQTEPVPVLAGQFDLNGNGEMTGVHWIRDAGYFTGPVCLTNSHSLGIVHHAAIRYMIDTHKDHFRKFHAWAMPVVAETYDGVCSDICGLHVTEDHALSALRGARGGPLAEGNVGGGTGTATYEFKGGTGTSSRRFELNGRTFTVGVLVQSNFGKRSELTVLGVPVGKHLTDNAIFSDHRLPEQGSIIVVIATDVPMTAMQLERLAKRGALGIGRTGTSGGHYSGDLMIAFSVANPIYLPAIGETQPFTMHYESLNDAHCDEIYPHAIDAIEEAVVNALFAAETIPTFKPRGLQLTAIDKDALVALLARHGRLRT